MKRWKGAGSQYPDDVQSDPRFTRVPVPDRRCSSSVSNQISKHPMMERRSWNVFKLLTKTPLESWLLMGDNPTEDDTKILMPPPPRLQFIKRRNHSAEWTVIATARLRLELTSAPMSCRLDLSTCKQASSHRLSLVMNILWTYYAGSCP